MPKLIQLYDKSRPYLKAIMVFALAHVGQSLVILDNVKLRQVLRQRFEEHLAELAGRAYDKHKSLTKLLASLTVAAPIYPVAGLQLDQHGLKSQISQVEGQAVEIHSMLKQMQEAMLGQAEGTNNANDMMLTAGLAGGYANACDAAKFKAKLSQLHKVGARVERVVAHMQPSLETQDAHFAQGANVSTTDCVDASQLPLVQLSSPFRAVSRQTYMVVSILEGKQVCAQPLLDGGSVVTMVISEFVRQYGLKTYPRAPEKFLAIIGQTLVTKSTYNFKIQTGGKDLGLLLCLKGVRVLAMYDIQFMIGVDVMYSSEWIKLIAVDYLGEVTLVTSKPRVMDCLACGLVVPEQYRKQLPPAPPWPGTGMSSPAPLKPPPAAPPKQPASTLQPAPPSAPTGQKKNWGKGKELHFNEQQSTQFEPSCPNGGDPRRIVGLRGQLLNDTPREPRRSAQPLYYPSRQMTLEKLSVPISTVQISKHKKVHVRCSKQRQGKVPFDQFGGMFSKLQNLLKEVGINISRHLELKIYRDYFHGQHTPWTSETLVAKALQMHLEGKTPKQTTKVMKALGMGSRTSGRAFGASTSGIPGQSCLGSIFDGLRYDARNQGKLAGTFPPIAQLARLGQGQVKELIAKLSIPSSATANAKAKSAQAAKQEDRLQQTRDWQTEWGLLNGQLDPGKLERHYQIFSSIDIG